MTCPDCRDTREMIAPDRAPGPCPACADYLPWTKSPPLRADLPKRNWQRGRWATATAMETEAAR